jgi:Mg2+/Co2+ transporter CorB
MTGAWLDTEADRVESRADLRNRLGSLLDRSGLSEERKSEILNAFTVGDRPVGEVMTSREETVFLTTTEPVETQLDSIGESPHTRFPLVGAEPSDFRGIVYVPTVVDRIDELRGGACSFEDIAAPPMTLHADVPISEAVDRFQAQHQELALVYDDPGETVVGLITATDALEAVMGEIEDPIDVDLVSCPWHRGCSPRAAARVPRPGRPLCGAERATTGANGLSPVDVDDTPPTTRVSQSTALTESHPTATGRLDVCPATTARRLS